MVACSVSVSLSIRRSSGRRARAEGVGVTGLQRHTFQTSFFSFVKEDDGELRCGI